jgi:hypothetical protein
MTQYLTIRKIYGRITKRLGKAEGFNLLWKVAKANWGPLLAREHVASISLKPLTPTEQSLAFITAIAYYIPHYLLQRFITYLENDPTRSHPAWGWFLAFGLFISNAAVFLASGIIWSISTTVLQARIKLQLNTMLFAKTLAKKDIAAMGDDTGREDAGKKEDKEGKEEKEDDEGVSSKSQIMVCLAAPLQDAKKCSVSQTLFTVDVDRLTDFVFHAFAVVDAPVEIVV